MSEGLSHQNNFAIIDFARYKDDQDLLFYE